MPQIVACFIFFVSMNAENNRTPFDLPEAESELVAGYHTEYSAMKFAFFMLAEYSAMIVNCCLMVSLFFGGWTWAASWAASDRIDDRPCCSTWAGSVASSACSSSL